MKLIKAIAAFLFFALITVGIGYLGSISNMEGVEVACVGIGFLSLVASVVVPAHIINEDFYF